MLNARFRRVAAVLEFEAQALIAADPSRSTIGRGQLLGQGIKLQDGGDKIFKVSEYILKINQKREKMEKQETIEKQKSERKPEPRKAPVSIEADEALIRMVEATNQGYHGGKVSKADLLSWLVINFEKKSFSAVCDDIRKHYFDKVAYLSSVVDELKKAQKHGRPGPDLDSLLAPITGKKSSLKE